MVRIFAILFLFLAVNFGFAQNADKFRYQSVLKGSATISPGYLLNSTQTNIYINGDLEYFPEEHVSLRGESFAFVGAQQKTALLKENSCFMFGALYHFHKNRLDYFIGLQTGASLAKPNDTYDSTFIGRRGFVYSVSSPETYSSKILPLISPVTGVTFYVNNYFNFFLNVRYIKSRYYGHRDGQTLLLDEIRISAGLGFQIHLKKKS
jgi:hypothetical protein